MYTYSNSPTEESGDVRTMYSLEMYSQENEQQQAGKSGDGRLVLRTDLL